MRIYPDDCWIDTFEPTLSTTELANAKRYWRRIWRAGGVEADERAAWRALVTAHGSGRAGYIVDTYQPTNLADHPTKAAPADEILVIPTQTPLAAAEATAAVAYWQAVWLAAGDAAKQQAARAALDAAVGAPRAAELDAGYVPFNLSDVRRSADVAAHDRVRRVSARPADEAGRVVAGAAGAPLPRALRRPRLLRRRAGARGGRRRR